MSQPTLPTRTSSFFASIQLEWVGSNLSVFTVWSPLISLLSLQIKYSGEACSAVRWPVNLQPAVTAFISCHENRSSKQTTLLQGRRQRGGKKQHHGQTMCITEHGFSYRRHMHTNQAHIRLHVSIQEPFQGRVIDSGLCCWRKCIRKSTG